MTHTPLQGREGQPSALLIGVSLPPGSTERAAVPSSSPLTSGRTWAGSGSTEQGTTPISAWGPALVLGLDTQYSKVSGPDTPCTPAWGGMGVTETQGEGEREVKSDELARW